MNTLVRFLYCISMYCGIRAVFNRARSRLLHQSRIICLDQAEIKLANDDRVKLRVHSRPAPPGAESANGAGMISIYDAEPKIPRFLYAVLRMSSHFGCGHCEIAFYEVDSEVRVFAVRNTLDSNLARLGLRGLRERLPWKAATDEAIVVAGVFEKLRQNSFDPRLSSPDDCLRFAVTSWLLNPVTRNQTRRSISNRHRRLAKQIFSLEDVSSSAAGETTALN